MNDVIFALSLVLVASVWDIAIAGTVIVNKVTGIVTYTGNNYEDVPDDIPGNVNVIRFLRNNKIRNVDSFPMCPALTSLDLSSNLLVNFPNLANASSELITLKLSKNIISHVDAERLDCLVKLQTLDLSQNELSSLPDVRGPSSSLTTLQLDYNHFKRVPSLVNLGASITNLELDANLISAIPAESLAGLDSITTLSMGYNRLTSFPDLRLVGGTLQILAVSFNPNIKQIPVEILNSLEVLQLLFAVSVGLEVMPDFSSSPARASLMSMALSLNNIHSIPIHTLVDFPALYALDVTSNPVTTLPNVCHMTNRLVVTITANSLVCDCHVRWLKRRELSGSLSTLGSSLKPCAAPTELRGVMWKHITMDNLTCKGEAMKHGQPRPITAAYGCTIDDVTHWVHASSLPTCAGLCLQTTGCEYFRYGDPDVTGVHNCGLTDAMSPFAKLFLTVAAGMRNETWFSLD